MADVLNLLGMILNFVGALLLLLFRIPGLDVTADGRDIGQGEPTPEARSKNLRRYWKNEMATRAGLICLCIGFALQIAGYVYPDYGSDTTDTRISRRVEAPRPL